MPTYDYKCENCEHQLEALQSMKDEPLKLCPKCNTEGLKRMIGMGAGLIFKGSGFYLTDYKNAKPGNASSPSASSKQNTDTDSKSDNKSEKKTDTKSEPNTESTSTTKSSDTTSKKESD